MENFGKTTYTIGKLRKKYVRNAYHIIFLNAYWYRKHDLKIACFDARAPRWESWGETPHIRFKINFLDEGFRASKKKTAHVFFTTWKQEMDGEFLPLEKPWRIWFYFLKMYFLSGETVTHIHFKIRVSKPQRRKQLMYFSKFEKRKWLEKTQKTINSHFSSKSIENWRRYVNGN